MNRFLDKLETRFKSKHEKSLAKPRSYGSPNAAPAPSGIPSWMVHTSSDDSSAHASSPGPADHSEESGSEDDLD